MQEHEIQPGPWTLGEAMTEATSRFGAAAKLAWPQALFITILAHLGSDEQQAIDTMTATELVALALAAIALCGLVMMLYVWMLRTMAPALGISPRPVSWLGVYGTGVLLAGLIVLGFVLLVLPGVFAVFALTFVGPVVAFEGVGGWAAMRASWHTARVALGATVGIVLLTIVAPSVLDPTTWAVDAPTALIVLWQFALWMPATIYGGLLTAVACMHARGGSPARVRQTA